jgi:hypothetical protein
MSRGDRVRQTFTLGSFLNHKNWVNEWQWCEVAMKSFLVIVLGAVVLVTVGTLAIMNNACKSGQHNWCVPMSKIRHPIKLRRS